MSDPARQGASSDRRARGAEAVVHLVLAAITVLLAVLTLRDLITYYPYGVDLEIPLRAAARWSSGGEPYLAEAFEVTAGPELPFLYPPFVLPFLTPLLDASRAIVFPAWTLVCVAAGIAACRRLALPWPIVPLVLIWPPFAEGILGGNVQIVLFAAFTAVLWHGGGTPFRPRPRDPRDAARPAAAHALLPAAWAAARASDASSRHLDYGALVL